jgi:hypothetical protein
MAELVYSSNGVNRNGDYICQYKRWTGSRFEYFTVYSPQPCGATYGAQLDATENISSDIQGQRLVSPNRVGTMSTRATQQNYNQQYIDGFFEGICAKFGLYYEAYLGQIPLPINTAISPQVGMAVEINNVISFYTNNLGTPITPQQAYFYIQQIYCKRLELPNFAEMSIILGQYINNNLGSYLTVPNQNNPVGGSTGTVSTSPTLTNLSR